MPPLHQHGGLLQKMRMRYTARRKLGLLASAKRIMDEEGVTCVLLTGAATVAHQHTNNFNGDAGGVSGHSLLGHDGQVILLMFFVRVGRCVHLHFGLVVNHTCWAHLRRYVAANSDITILSILAAM